MKNRFLKFKKLLISAAAFCIAAMPLSAGMAVGAVKYIDEPKTSATLSYEKEDTAGATVNKAERYAELEGEPARDNVPIFIVITCLVIILSGSSVLFFAKRGKI